MKETNEVYYCAKKPDIKLLAGVDTKSDTIRTPLGGEALELLEGPQKAEVVAPLRCEVKASKDDKT